MAALILFFLSCRAGWAASNQLDNGDFERAYRYKGGAFATGKEWFPRGWSLFWELEKKKLTFPLEKLVSQSKLDAAKGSSSIVLKNSDLGFQFLGIYQEVKVRKDDHFEFSAFVRNDAADRLVGQSFGVLTIEWYDRGGRQISRKASQRWRDDLSEDQWVKYVVDDVAPTNAEKVRFVVTMMPQGEVKGGFLVDGAAVAKIKSDPQSKRP
ncbi:MAG: hypothetical protein L0209_11265 [candidate division Zixibacteria bacterium]|nr:hypothetical protein [candidate division Zixibacteria bacterium]